MDNKTIEIQNLVNNDNPNKKIRMPSKNNDFFIIEIYSNDVNFTLKMAYYQSIIVIFN